MASVSIAPAPNRILARAAIAARLRPGRDRRAAPVSRRRVRDVTRASVRRTSHRTLVTFKRAALEFVEDRGHRSAAQISFFAILSFIPLVLLLAAAFGLLFDDAAVRERIITTVFDNIPLASGGDRPKLERAVGDALEQAGHLGIFSTLLVIVAASGVMGALRHSINEAWDIDERPPLLQRKALDLALVLGGTSILALSLSLTVTHRLSDIVDDEAGGGWIVAAALDVASELLPLAFVALALLFLYRVLPMRKEPLRDVWPGAVVAAIGLAIVKLGLELYFARFADLGAIYGSLGALMALLIFVYAATNVIVFGAEFASEWARLPDIRARSSS
jgi:membrane protein